MPRGGIVPEGGELKPCPGAIPEAALPLLWLVHTAAVKWRGSESLQGAHLPASASVHALGDHASAVHASGDHALAVHALGDHASAVHALAVHALAVHALGDHALAVHAVGVHAHGGADCPVPPHACALTDLCLGVPQERKAAAGPGGPGCGVPGPGVL